VNLLACSIHFHGFLKGGKHVICPMLVSFDGQPIVFPVIRQLISFFGDFGGGAFCRKAGFASIVSLRRISASNRVRIPIQTDSLGLRDRPDCRGEVDNRLREDNGSE
jgi:hypothetical protein